GGITRMTLNRQFLVFSSLCLLAPTAFVLYALTYLIHQRFAVACSVAGFAFSVVLFGWSLWSLRRHRVRAVVGLVVCLVVFWLILIIPGYVEAKKRGLHGGPNQTVQRTGASRVAQSVIQTSSAAG